MNLRILSLLGALALAPFLHADSSFTGKIHLSQTDAKGRLTNLVQYVRSDALRMEIQGQPVATILDFKNKQTIILMLDEQMYMVHSLDPKDIPAKAMKGAAAQDPDIEVTGKTEKILGYECIQVIVKDKKTTTEMWLSEELGAFAGFGPPGGGMLGKGSRDDSAAKWETALKGRGGMPLRVVSFNAKGKEVSRMEATKIEQGAVTDADFTPPKNFKKFEMPSMGGFNPFK